MYCAVDDELILFIYLFENIFIHKLVSSEVFLPKCPVTTENIKCDKIVKQNPKNAKMHLNMKY